MICFMESRKHSIAFSKLVFRYFISLRGQKGRMYQLKGTRVAEEGQSARERERERERERDQKGNSRCCGRDFGRLYVIESFQFVG